MKGKGIV